MGKASDGNKGFAVDTLTNNEFGNALKNLGIDSGWKITECANKVLGNKMFVMLKNQISAAAKKDPTKGYVVIFENPNGGNDIVPKQTKKPIPSKQKSIEEKKVDLSSQKVTTPKTETKPKTKPIIKSKPM